jgi:hypothetical protein
MSRREQHATTTPLRFLKMLEPFIFNPRRNVGPIDTRKSRHGNEDSCDRTKDPADDSIAARHAREFEIAKRTLAEPWHSDIQHTGVKSRNN